MTYSDVLACDSWHRAHSGNLPRGGFINTPRSRSNFLPTTHHSMRSIIMSLFASALAIMPQPTTQQPPSTAPGDRPWTLVESIAVWIALITAIDNTTALLRVAPRLLAMTRTGRALSRKLQSQTTTLEPFFLPIWWKITKLLAPLQSRCTD